MKEKVASWVNAIFIFITILRFLCSFVRKNCDVARAFLLLHNSLTVIILSDGKGDEMRYQSPIDVLWRLHLPPEEASSEFVYINRTVKVTSHAEAGMLEMCFALFRMTFTIVLFFLSAYFEFLLIRAMFFLPTVLYWTIPLW